MLKRLEQIEKGSGVEEQLREVRDALNVNGCMGLVNIDGRGESKN